MRLIEYKITEKYCGRIGAVQALISTPLKDLDGDCAELLV